MRVRAAIFIGMGLMFFLSLIQFVRWQQFAMQATVHELRLLVLPSAQTKAVHVELGRMANTLKQFQKSAAHFQQVVDQDPNHLVALGNLAMALARVADFDAALPVFQAYFDGHGEAYDVEFWYGHAIHRRASHKTYDTDMAGLKWMYRAVARGNDDWELVKELVHTLEADHNYYSVLALVAGLTSGIPERDSQWSYYVSQTELKTGEASGRAWYLPFFTNAPAFVPVKMAPHSRFYYVPIETTTDKWILPTEILREFMPTLPATRNQSSIRSLQGDLTVDQVVLSEVQLGPLLLKDVTVYHCTTCPLQLPKKTLEPYIQQQVRASDLELLVMRGDVE